MSFTSSNNTARRGNTIYAIAFDLDVEMLSKSYGNQNYNNAYNDIKNTLAQYGFVRQQGSVYFGVEADAVKTVIATQALAKKYSWFVPSVKDIQMLRIEENSDLMPALENINNN